MSGPESKLRTLLITLAVVLFVLSTGYAQAQDRGVGGTSSAASAPEGKGARVALVMGNAAYANGPLQNPVNDATDIAGALKQCGFTVSLKTDCDLRTMKAALDEFGSRIPPDGVALFFYAGHGMQVNGRNYLVPIGAAPTSAGDVEFECLDSGRVLVKLEEGGARLNMVILDACRNNPLSRSWSRAVPQGLASMEAPTGSILLYATAPGKVASDGKGRNGLYTGSLLKYLATPNMDVVDVFRKTGDEVRRATSDAQVPWLSLSFTGTFSFVSKGESTTSIVSPSMPVSTTPLPPPPTESLGGLQVRVNVSNALVKVNGEERGPASPGKPANVGDLAPGKVIVEVLAEGYEAEPKEFEVEEGKWTTATFKLTKVMVVKPEEPKRPPTVSVGGQPRAGEERAFAGIQFVWIPAGTFTMGSPANEDGRKDGETQHKVTLTRGFWLGKYEVTQAQWVSVMRDNPPSFKGDELPVNSVSWDDCQEFIGKLNQGGNGTFRLPTEAEWEYACRAGSTAKYGFGDSDAALGDHAWYDANSGLTTHPVGQKQPNGWGLYDMHGNVWERCMDLYGDYPSGSVTDPSGPAAGEGQVLRGGSWNSYPSYCRAAYRHDFPPDRRYPEIGFRLLRTQN